jgi:putative transposase
MEETRKAYPSDLTDEEWALIEPLVPAPKSGGRPATITRREIVNALFYLSRNGVVWRALPHDLPNWSTVYQYYSRWYKAGIWQTILETLTGLERIDQGRLPQPTAAVIDSQSVKTAQGGSETGFDAAKKVKGRKRHILVDTLGLLLMVLVTSAATSEELGGQHLLNLSWWRPTTKRIRLIWADNGYYEGRLLGFVTKVLGWTLSIVNRPKGRKGFVLLPRRWVVERTFSWLNWYRRLSKDYEKLPASSQAQVQLAMISLLRKRLGRRRQERHSPWADHLPVF